VKLTWQATQNWLSFMLCLMTLSRRHIMSDGGKGHTQRPRSIADEEWANRWEAIFGRDKPEQAEKNDDDSHSSDEIIKDVK